jgi:multiple sugar transport system substrate-binding protein
MKDLKDLGTAVAGPTTRRQFIRWSGGAVASTSLLGALAACGGSGGGGKALTLSISPDLVGLMRGPVTEWGKRNGQEVKIRISPSDTGAYFDRVRTQLQGGYADVDVIAGDISWPAQLADNGWLADLSDRFTAAERSAYLPAAVAANTYKGKIYGVPFFTDVGLLWYRKDLLERHGFTDPPETWDELTEMALKIKSDEAKIKYGHVFTGANYEGGTVLGLEFIRSAGGEALKGTDVLVGQPASVRGLQIQRGLVTSGVSPASVADDQEDQVAGAFLGGQAVFMRNWPYVFGSLTDKQQSDITPAQVGITHVPVADKGAKSTNVGGGWNLFVNAASQKQDAAWKLIEFIASAPQQRERALKGSYLPTRNALYEDAAVVKDVPAVARAKAEIFQTTTPPVSAYYADISEVLSQQFNASLRGAATPEQAAGTIQDKLKAIIEKGA